jgi:hypothetical protein
MRNLELGQGLSRIVSDGNIVMVIGPIDTNINHDFTSLHKRCAFRFSHTGAEALSDPVDGLIWVVGINNILLIIQFRK